MKMRLSLIIKPYVVQEKNIERGCVLEILRDALGTIWDFLHCDASLT